MALHIEARGVHLLKASGRDLRGAQSGARLEARQADEAARDFKLYPTEAVEASARATVPAMVTRDFKVSADALVFGPTVEL